jgi:uncharacterized protein YceK
MLAAVLGAATAIALLSGCASGYDRYAYGYGPGGYYGGRYVSYSDRYGNCWYDRFGEKVCVRVYDRYGNREYDRYAYGYGNGSYYGDRYYRTFDGSYSDCWLDQSGSRQCVRS